MSELSMALDALAECGRNLVSVAERLGALYSGGEENEGDSTPAETPVDTAPQKEQAEPAKKKAADKAATPKEVTLEVVRAALAEKSRAGKTAAVKELLTKHGADRLSDVDPSEYAALLAESEVL